MNLKEIGFPYKHYETEKLNRALKYIQAQYFNYEILEASDHHFVAEKKKEPVIDKYALKRKGLAPFISKGIQEQTTVDLSDNQIDFISHDLRLERGIYSDTYLSYFGYKELFHYDFEQSCFEQPSVMQLCHQNEVDMITNQLEGSIVLQRWVPLDQANYTILRDTLGSSVSSIVATDYLQKHPDEFQHRDNITLSLKTRNKLFVDSLSDALLEAEFVKEANYQDDQFGKSYVSDQLTYYQELKELLFTKDFQKISDYIINSDKKEKNMGLEVHYTKRDFSRFPFSNQTLYTNFYVIRHNDQRSSHRSHIIVPKGLAVPDFVAKGVFGLKNFDVVEQGEKIQKKVYQKLRIKK